MLVKAIFQLKQDVDRLKQAVFGNNVPARPAERLPQWEEDVLEPDEQVFESHGAEEGADESLPLSLHDVNDDLIRKALEKYGNRKAAAKALGISERTLYRKIKNMEDRR